MTGQITRNNHYVPRWYQRGFTESGQSQLYYLDMSLPPKMLPDGREVMPKRCPKACFFEYDLYSTHFGNVVNDEIERFLFGSIDARGSKPEKFLPCLGLAPLNPAGHVLRVQCPRPVIGCVVAHQPAGGGKLFDQIVFKVEDLAAKLG